MEKKIIYGLGRPRFENNLVLLLNSVFKIMFLFIKLVFVICKIPFVGGTDNKVIKTKKGGGPI